MPRGISSNPLLDLWNSKKQAVKTQKITILSLSDDELFSEINRYGFPNIPVVGSTRDLLMKILLKKWVENSMDTS